MSQYEWDLIKFKLRWWWLGLTGRRIKWSCPERKGCLEVETNSWEIRERIIWAHYKYHEDKQRDQ